MLFNLLNEQGLVNLREGGFNYPLTIFYPPADVLTIASILENVHPYARARLIKRLL